jgi:hypothetical protein
MRYTWHSFGRLVLVWHVPSCCQIPHVLWVDDESMCVATADLPLTVGPGGGVRHTVHQHQRVVVMAHASLILVDPVEDADAAPAEAEREAVSPVLEWFESLIPCASPLCIHGQSVAQAQPVYQGVSR